MTCAIPLHTSCKWNNSYVLVLVLVQDAMGYSALIAACLGEFVDVVRVLLEHGANVDYQDKV